MRRFLPLLLLVATTAIAQKNIDPTPEDIAQAKQLHAKYEKDDIVLLDRAENVAFDTKAGNVTVTYNVKEKLMNISPRADIKKYEFYDTQTKIDYFTLKYRNDKSAYFSVKDEFYADDDLFYADYRVKYMDVDFPVQGYTYTYEMGKKYDDIKYFTTLYFQGQYPTLKKEVNITVPDWLDFEIKEFNFNGYDIKKTQRRDEKLKATVYTYLLENADAMAKDKSAPGPSYLYPHLLFVAKSFTAKDGKKTTLFNSTADLYKWYHSLVTSMEENPAALKDKVKELTEKATTDDQKIKNIYYWVQDNIRYIAFEDGLAGFKPESSQNVFAKRYGDCKGMANLICRMLREAGFDARLTWIGTKHIAYDYSIPSLSVDNHMICTLFKDGKKYFLDGTEKFNSMGEYAERIQGKEVMIEDGDTYIIEKVPVLPPTANTEVFTSHFHIDNDQLAGKVSGTKKGESRASFLYSYNNIKNDKKEKSLQYYLTDGDKNFSISNIVTSDLADRDKVLTMEYDAVLKNKVSSFDSEMYVDLDFDTEFAGFDFKERKTDYEFRYKQDYVSNITLDIPAGYKVTHLPESLTASNNDYDIKVSYEQQGNTVLYKKHFTIKSGRIKKSGFSEWKQVVTSLNNLYNDQITLTKQ